MNIKLSINECHWKWSSITTTRCRKRTSGGTGYASVNSGVCNCATNTHANIVGGICNIASGTHSFIGSGCCNLASGSYGAIAGGAYNQVVTPGIASFVGAGTFHCVDGNHSGVMAGKLNHLTGCLSAIAAGYANHIGSGGDCSFIGGGKNNCVTGAYSAILGGSGNCDNGLNYVGIFGQNINVAANMSANTFHVECLNAYNTPCYGTQPPGSIVFITCGTAIPAGAKALYII